MSWSWGILFGFIFRATSSNPPARKREIPHFYITWNIYWIKFQLSKRCCHNKLRPTNKQIKFRESSDESSRGDTRRVNRIGNKLWVGYVASRIITIIIIIVNFNIGRVHNTDPDHAKWLPARLFIRRFNWTKFLFCHKRSRRIDVVWWSRARFLPLLSHCCTLPAISLWSVESVSKTVTKGELFWN